MIRYKSTKQLSIEEFKTPFEITLDVNNRWVKLGYITPWDELANIYYRTMSREKGAPAKDARLVIGALIIKHMLKLDDREVIETIRENPYIQFFLGLSEYSYEDVFDRSLLTHLRYRIGIEKFDAMTQELIKAAEQIRKDSGKKEEDEKSITGESESDISPTQPMENENKGQLLVDATVPDQMIVYPTDLGLLSASREESERLIDIICKNNGEKTKPRTYRRKARKQYLAIAKKKKKTNKEIHKAIGKQLNYLKRNIGSIHKLLDKAEEKGPFPWIHRDQQIFWVIQHIYEQQQWMYTVGTHSVDNRIVNIYQPYVRPIVRGKDKAKVEFGAKLGVSLCDGYARINNFSWEAYHEASDLKIQVQDYHNLHGYYPEVVIGDQIYGTQENRRWLKELGIRYSGKPLGRPSKLWNDPLLKKQQRLEQGKRNEIEGKFGQGKNGYNLNKIRARKSRTSQSWIACIFFVMNLIRFSKDFLFSFLNEWYLKFKKVLKQLWIPDRLSLLLNLP